MLVDPFLDVLFVFVCFCPLFFNLAEQSLNTQKDGFYQQTECWSKYTAHNG